MGKKTRLKIGEFSQLMQVTVKTLRHYEQKGLLLPDEVDDRTGYRYYSIDQMQKLQAIRDLQRLGFSLDEIKDLFEDNSHIPSIRQLTEKINETETQLKQLITRRNLLLDWRNTRKEMKTMDKFSIQSLPEFCRLPGKGLDAVLLQGIHHHRLHVIAAATEIVAHALQRLLADVAQQNLLACRDAAHDSCSHTSGTQECHHVLLFVSVKYHSRHLLLNELIYLLDEFGGIAANDGVGFHVFGHHGACCYHGILAHGDTGQDGRPCSDPCVTADVLRLTQQLVVLRGSTTKASISLLELSD